MTHPHDGPHPGHGHERHGHDDDRHDHRSGDADDLAVRTVRTVRAARHGA